MLFSLLHPLLTVALSGGATVGQDAGRAIALGVGAGGGAAGAGAGIGMLFGKVIESVTRQPEMRDEITVDPVAGIRAHRGGVLLRPRRRVHRVLPLRPVMTSLPIAFSGSFLITPNVGLMIWTLVVFVISLYILCKAVFPRISRGARPPPARDRGVDRRGRAGPGRRPSSCSPSTASGSRRRAGRRRRSSPAPAQAAETHEREAQEEARAARAADGADAARHRGRDPPRDPGDPPARSPT